MKKSISLNFIFGSVYTFKYIYKQFNVSRTSVFTIIRIFVKPSWSVSTLIGLRAKTLHVFF